MNIKERVKCFDGQCDVFKLVSKGKYTSPAEWVVTQSWSRQLESDEKSTDTDGQNHDFGQTANENLSISVINGTTTVVSYSVSDTFSYSSGDIEGIDNTAAPEDWTIPDEWKDKAAYPEDDGDQVKGATVTGGKKVRKRREKHRPLKA